VARVLIVDDEPDILLLQRLNLEGAGFDVVMAADGQRALERIDSDEPDAVVLDVMMPVLDGWGVLERLQDRDGAPPVIVVSAKTASADIVHALRLGALDYLPKPFDSDELVHAVSRLLDSSRPERARYREALLARHGG
jgi:DNA-binding response OmpR family regulator